MLQAIEYMCCKLYRVYPLAAIMIPETERYAQWPNLGLLIMKPNTPVQFNTLVGGDYPKCDSVFALFVLDPVFALDHACTL